MAGVSKEEYLKRYLSKGSGLGKKKKKVKTPKRFNVQIIDDDADFKIGDTDLTAEDPEDEAPTVAEIVDERPEHIKRLEEYRKDERWKVIGKTNRKDDFSDQDYGIITSGKKVTKQGSMSHHTHHDVDSDLSPPRAKRHDSDSDNSLVRKSKLGHDSLNSSPVTRTRHDSGSDQSPPRRKRHDSGSDQSPPRRKRHDSGSDQSPPRRKRHDSGSDQSPPRRKRHDSGSDQSPPRRKRHDSDSDQSPPRRREKGHEADQSSPRRKGHDSDSDQSPPRKKQSNQKCDQSLPRKRKPGTECDNLPARKNRCGSDLDQTPPRKRKKDGDDQSVTRQPHKSDGKLDKTLGGAKAGLSSAAEMRKEAEKLRMKEEQMFLQIDHDLLGRDAETVFRDKSGKRRNLAAEREEEAKKKAEERKYQDWGQGLKQMAMRENKLQDYIHESSKPLARYKDDNDLDRLMRDQDREGDPMAVFLKKKNSGNPANEKPRYRGPPPPPNRFGLMPGYRWDGVDRSNGFENKIFSKLSQQKATKEHAYKWSTEDM